MSGDWTLDELAGRVAEALAAAEVRAPNARVTEVPDSRVIRWYTTTGLVDRPSAMRGRTALYGPRHLWQLVAIKRLQAQGRSLAEIQAEIAGAPEATLRRLAAVPLRDRASDDPAPPPSPPALDGATAPDGSRRLRFWAEAPAPPVDAAVNHDTVEAMHGFALGGGAVLLLPGPLPAGLGKDEVAAIRAAARPLLDLLATRPSENTINDDTNDDDTNDHDTNDDTSAEGAQP